MMYVCIYIYICNQMCVYIYNHMYVCVYIYIYININVLWSNIQNL